MMSEFSIDEDLLTALIEKDISLFNFSINSLVAYNTLFALTKNVPPNILLNKENERTWDNRIIFKNRLTQHLESDLRAALNNSSYYALGFRKIADETPSMALYVPDYKGENVFALIDFRNKVSCSRVLSMGEYPFLERWIETRGTIVDKEKIVEIKKNLSSFYSSNVYKGENV